MPTSERNPIFRCPALRCPPLGPPELGWCQSTVRPVFPMLVFQLGRLNRTVLLQPPQPYSEPSEPYSDKDSPLRRALRRLLSWLGSQLGIHRNLGLSPLGAVHEAALGHLLTHPKESLSGGPHEEKAGHSSPLPLFHRQVLSLISGRKTTWGPPFIGDTLGVSLGGSQAPPSFWKVPGLSRKFPELPWKFFGDFPASSPTVDLNSNPEVPRKFPRLPRKFPGLPQKFPGFPRRSAPFFGKPDTLS